MNSETYNHLDQWRKLVNEQKPDTEKWTEIPAVPGYEFLNLRIISVSEPEETEHKHEITMNFVYDASRPIEGRKCGEPILSEGRKCECGEPTPYPDKPNNGKMKEFKIIIGHKTFTADKWVNLVQCDGEFIVQDIDDILYHRFMKDFAGDGGKIRKKAEIVFHVKVMDFDCKFFDCVLKDYMIEEKKVILHYDYMQSPHIRNGKAFIYGQD